ncbi:hypothetical protein [Isoptericola jiangsuensis]|uniref:hypothetical protein n=1 Tax=Isoptericola jiangsuensis TaxID=548579 RepID=UPI001145A87C|nr:hypothetical protein [Isoptericola jiangsuensis]
MKLIIGAGVLGAGLLWWLASGQPGVSPKDGDYACLIRSSFDDHQRAEEQGMPYTYNFLEDQYGVTLEDGRMTEARVYLAESDVSTPAQTSSNYSFGSKLTPTSFTATIEGVSVGCFPS